MHTVRFFAAPDNASVLIAWRKACQQMGVSVTAITGGQFQLSGTPLTSFDASLPDGDTRIGDAFTSKCADAVGTIRNWTDEIFSQLVK